MLEEETSWEKAGGRGVFVYGKAGRYPAYVTRPRTLRHVTFLDP